ncbi:MAG: heme-binding protein [Rhodospirillaceae bacterium]|nr:heme-binding protein [Rhodospirillaceae bacterium]
MSTDQPGAAGRAPLIGKRTLSLAAAQAVAAAAQAEAQRNGWAMCIAVVDDGGHLLCLHRMDGTQTGSIDIAIAKARCAAAFRRPTKAFEEAVADGRTALLALPGFVPVEGGLPLTAEGGLVGAVGVSGGRGVEDGRVAEAGAAALRLGP